MIAQSSNSLADIGAAVRDSLGSAAMFQVLNTRLIIQSGVDLKAPSPEQNNDPALVQRVREALLRKALAVDPTFVQARRALLRTLDTRPADAVAMCRDWVAASPKLS